MKNAKKTLLLCLCVAALLVTTVVGTLAYLTDRASVTNTFTVGKVDITVDEAKVNADGTAVTPEERTETGNQYHLIPGQIYIKDPTMTVLKDSEESYVRLLVTFNCAKELDTIFAPTGADLMSIFVGYDENNWKYIGKTEDAGANTITYEFRYKETVKPDGADVELDPLFDSFTVPGALDGDDLASIKDLTITVKGHAIQAATFDDADAAWAAFDAQMNSQP